MATKTRWKFTPEFRRGAVALLQGSGRPRMRVAAERGIQLSMLRNWRAILDGEAPRVRPRGFGGDGRVACGLVG